MALVMVLVAVVLISLASTVPLRQARLELQREREAELLFAGRQIRDAIADYVATSPGPQKRYPTTLGQLLSDDRFPSPRRHLRRLYRDPFTQRAEWTLIREQGAIVGVASQGEAMPLKRAGFDPGEEAFADAARVSDWQFVHRASETAGGSGSSPAAPGSGAGTGTDGGAPASPAPLPAIDPPVPPGPSASDRALCMPRYVAALQACGTGDFRDLASCREGARQDWQRCLRGS